MTSAFAFIQRVRWVTDVLDPDPGGAYSLCNLRDGPLENTFRSLAGEALLRRRVLAQRSSTAPGVSSTIEDPGEPEWICSKAPPLETSIGCHPFPHSGVLQRQLGGELLCALYGPAELRSPRGA